MKRVLFLLLVLVLMLLTSCKKSEPPRKVFDASAAPPAPLDAAGEPDEPDEATVRAGKRTGLESADSKPEVATEPLLRALLAGQVQWARFVDPAAGVVELRGADVQRRCGVDLENALATFSAAITAALADPGLIYDLQCDNVGLTVTIAGVTSHAVCTASNPADEGTAYDVVFIPDATLGLKIIGIAAADATVSDEALDRFDEEMGRYGARCP